MCTRTCWDGTEPDRLVCQGRRSEMGPALEDGTEIEMSGEGEWDGGVLIVDLFSPRTYLRSEDGRFT